MRTIRPLLFATTLLSVSCFAEGLLTLQTSIREAVATNPTVAEKVKYYRTVKEDIKISRANYFPTVGLSASYGLEQNEDSTTGYEEKGSKRMESSLIIKQMVFDGFETKYDVLRGEMRLEAAAYSAVEEAEAVGLEVSRSYLEVLKQKKLLKLAKENLDTHKKIFNDIKERVDSGASPQSEANQAASRLALSNSNVLVQNNNFKNAGIDFHKVVGREVDANSLVIPDADIAIPKTLQEAEKKSSF